MDKIKYPKTDFFRKLGDANIEELIKRVSVLPESIWTAKNSRHQNKGAALVDASHIIFRFIKDFNNVYDYEDKALWDEWDDALSSIMHQAAQALGYKEYVFPRIMLARLPAGACIHPHIDNHASYYVHKIHVPLMTNPKTIFHVDDQEMHMEVGHIIEVNNKKGHAVYNDGDTDRIHLIFECYNKEDYGKPS
ncbi:aspartyl/asparaginyl beta-hydroxylase domain-containing protein [Colwelliaceae bacterium 6471]